jgi:hypothetical protein
MYLYIIVLHIFDAFDVRDVVVCVVHIFLMFCSFQAPRGLGHLTFDVSFSYRF